MAHSTKRLTKKQFVAKAQAIHGDRYDYTDSVYHSIRSKIKIRCRIHGEFEQTTKLHLKGRGCPKCKGQNAALKLRMPSDEVLRQMKAKHGDKYDYSKAVIKGKKIHKIEIICPKHGTFWQTPSMHISGQGCPECGLDVLRTHLVLSQEEFLKRAKDKHGDKYDYSKAVYTRLHEDVTIICSTHCEYTQPAYYHLSGSGCPKCAHQESKISKWEYRLLEGLEGFELSDRKVLQDTGKGRREIDLVNHEHKLGIEVDGLYWHCSLHHPRLWHLKKTEDMERLGYRLLHIWDYEVEEKYDLVLSMIRAKLGQFTHKLYARQCAVQEIPFNVYKDFTEANHLQGSSAAKVRLGLYHQDNLVAVMSFAKPRFDKTADWELIRFCCLQSYHVAGGASKLFTAFKRLYGQHGQIVVSYANRRFSDGRLYRQLGFELIGKSQPNYFYYRARGGERIPRYQAMKHKLKDWLPEFDEALSEEENMANNNYYRCYDCGNLIYRVTL